MKKKFAYLLMVTATFVLGVVVSPIRFRLYLIGCGKGSSSHFTSSYFLNLVSTLIPYDSAEKADIALQEKIKKADSVIEQTVIFNHLGEKTGSRAVIRSMRDDGKQYYAVVRTEKELLREITCSSLDHVLAFEKTLIR